LATSNPDLGMRRTDDSHGFSFQELERSSSPRSCRRRALGAGRMVSDLGWKDTVLVWLETVRIAIDFARLYGRPGPPFHCQPVGSP
jgi:suppressor of ftsI/bilirubin oxidase